MAERRQATPSPADAQATGPTALSVAAVGLSTAATCGVRDHATVLAATLRKQGVACSLHWLERQGEPFRAERRRIGAWTRALSRELAAGKPDTIVLHYSVFSYSHRGLPVFVRPTLEAMRATGIPLVTVLHEFAYPWRRDGARGTVWAVTQRAVLVSVMRASSAVVVTTDWRAEWLASRAWLPSRRTAVAPVFSNLPAAAGSAPSDHPLPVVGLFGYAYGRVTQALVLDALALLLQSGQQAELLLVGAPGRTSRVAHEWLDGARERGVSHALSFSGTLPAQELSDRLAACDVLLFVESSGPTSRKGTLAASLASGRPVLALDGPRSWRQLIDAGAAIAVQPSADALADTLARLLADETRREQVGARGRAFAAQAMTPEHSARVVAALAEEVVGLSS